MAGKEDPRRNFGAVGGGSAPAEKAEAEEEKKADLVCSGLVPCAGGRTPTAEEEPNAGSGLRGLWPCTGRHTQTAAEVKADLFPGGLKSCPLSHTPSEKENKEEDAVTSAKWEGSDAECGGGKSAGEEEMAEAAASAGDAKQAAEIKWEEMSLEYIAWVLSQKWEDYPVLTLEDHSLHRGRGSNMITDEELRDLMYTREEFDEHRELMLESQATSEAGREEFFAFQEWVRETFERNGRVMVPQGFNGPNPFGIQDLVDEEWEKGKHQLGL